MGEIAYHATVNELQGIGLCGKGPFGRLEWFALLEKAGHCPFIPTIRSGDTAIALPLTRRGWRLEPLTNWYAFTWAPLETAQSDPALLEALARALRPFAVSFLKLDTVHADRLEVAFRRAGYCVVRKVCDTNHYLAVNGRSFAAYLCQRPGPLRTTVRRKAKRMEIRLSRQFDPADWDAYETIYAASWKPAEGDPLLLRAFAESESVRGTYLLGMALTESQPVAAQFWTVEDGTAYIHKLAHVPDAEALSPGSVLTAALLEEVMERDRVVAVDFGTGNDRYKADWMEEVRPRFALTCIHPAAPRHWPRLAREALRQLVSPKAQD